MDNKNIIYTWIEKRQYKGTGRTLIKTYGLTIEGKRILVKYERKRI